MNDLYLLLGLIGWAIIGGAVSALYEYVTEDDCFHVFAGFLWPLGLLVILGFFSKRLIERLLYK